VVPLGSMVLVVVFELCGCGGGQRASRMHNTSHVADADRLPSVGRFQTPEEVKGIPILAKGRLPGGGRFVIFAEPHRDKADNTVYYTAMLAHAEPTRYEAKIPQPHIRDGMVWGKSGGVEIEHQRGTIAVSMVSAEGCTGLYPHTIIWGLVKNKRVTVTAYRGKKVVQFTKVRLPARLHASGELVYALLPFGRQDLVVAREGDRIISRETWPASITCRGS
jgi:hypothetical protein